MSESIRRSSRQPKKSTTSLYNVGDIVEITRNNVEAEGRLAYLLTEGTSANPRWLVKFDKEAWKDEELYERTFGKLVKRGDGSKPKTATSKPSSSSEGEEPSKKKKSVAFTEESPQMVSDSSSSKIKALERKQRSTRRQASIEVVKKRPLKNNGLAPANKRVKTNNDEVIVVPMLTGTLYLYRGLNRRAEFIRQC